MIEKIRQYSETWWFKTFLGLIALTFVLLWGGGDLLNQVTNNRQTVATVGDRRVTSWEFEKAVNRESTHISRQIGRQITPQEALDGGLYHSTLLKIIDETLVDLEASRLGLAVSDQAVREAITKNPLFQSSEGTFNKQNFLHLLSRLGYTETSFVEEIRRDMTRERLFDALFKGIYLPSEQTNFLYRWQEQTRQLSYALVDSAKIMIKETPTPSQLATFFKDNAATLKAPEFRDVTVLVIDAEKLADSRSVTGEELQQAFEERSSEFEGKNFLEVKSILEKEIKHSQALEEAYKLSTKAEDMIAGGGTLAEVGQQLSLPLKKVTKIDVRGNPDLFKIKDGRAPGLTDLDKAIATEAFTLDPQVVGSAIEVKNGLFFMAQVDKVHPEKQRAQGDVHPLYAQYLWRQYRKREKLFKAVEHLKQNAGDRGQLAIAANKHKIRLQSVKVSRKGASIPSSLSLTPKLLRDIFASKKGTFVSGLLNRPDDNPAFLVGIVEAIQYPALQGRSDDFDKFAKNLSQMLKEDFTKGYIASLRKRFAVNINQRFMKSMQKTSESENL